VLLYGLQYQLAYVVGYNLSYIYMIYRELGGSSDVTYGGIMRQVTRRLGTQVNVCMNVPRILQHGAEDRLWDSLWGGIDILVWGRVWHAVGNTTWIQVGFRVASLIQHSRAMVDVSKTLRVVG